MMNTFDSFIRFFPLADDGATRPQDLLLPSEPYASLPILPGDRLRWLVPVADCVSIPPEKLSVTIRPKGSPDVGTLCGRIRRQAGATYTEIRLRVDSPPTTGVYSQFALMTGERTVMNTFRGQQTEIEEYIQAIVDHFSTYSFAYVECDRIGREIRVRAYPNDRLRLSGEPLRIGLGTVRERNQNSPSLLAQGKLSVALSAEDRYTVSVSADIQKGNVFVLDSGSYQATGVEKPADILRALGVGSGKLSRPGGTTVVTYAQPGSQVVANTNKPALQLLFDTTSGGNDLYTVVISGDVQPGNSFQVAATGVTTKTVTASATDTKSTIEAQFNATAGRLVLPTGSVPIVTVIPGKQTVTNTNNPAIQLSGKTALPSRTRDQYTVWVGSSVVEGNQYELTVGTDTKTVTASATDTPLSIALKLGYAANPFSLEVTVGTTVRGIARRGPRYHEPQNLSPVTIISARTWQAIPYVCELTIPSDLPIGDYQLCLKNGEQLIGVSNYLNRVSCPKETVVLRFGGERPGSVFGLTYAEDGLMQQLRVRAYLAEPTLRQQENLYTTLDNQTVRGRTWADQTQLLLTQLEYISFHRNLYLALKHPVLYLDNRPLRCEGEYQQGAMVGTRHRRKRQATATMVACNRLEYRSASDAATDSLSSTYALIGRIAGLDGLWLAVKRLNFVETLTEGMVLPAADYELLIRAGSDPIRLTVGQDGIRAETFLLYPNRLNRVGLVRFGPGRVSLSAIPTHETESGMAITNYNPQQAEVTAVNVGTKPRPGDFGDDFSTDFSLQ